MPKRNLVVSQRQATLLANLNQQAAAAQARLIAAFEAIVCGTDVDVASLVSIDVDKSELVVEVPDA